MEVHSSLPARLFPMMYAGSLPGGSLHHLPGSNLTYSGKICSALPTAVGNCLACLGLLSNFLGTWNFQWENQDAYSMLNRAPAFVTLWTLVLQVPLSVGFQARTLEWVATCFSRGSSWPRDQTCNSCVSCIGRQILYHWAIGEALNK